MPWLYVNSFRPLAATPAGLDAVAKHGLPPFADGSIRREPDFEHPVPAITCLCRKAKFAPRLRVGDHVVYLTVKGVYGGHHSRHQRLVAVLRVDKLFASHADAARWYIEAGLPLPSNLMVRGNPPKPLRHSIRRAACGQARVAHRAWNAEYAQRAAENPHVVVCSRLHCFLDWSAPILSAADLTVVFGRPPSTQNPGRRDLSLLPLLLERARVVAARP